MGQLIRAVAFVLLTPILALGTALPTSAQQPAAQVDTTSVEYRQWRANLDDARADRSRGKKYFWIGLGVAAGAPLLGTALLSSTTSDTGLSAARLTGLASTVGGVGAIYGGITWLRAEDRVDELEREGRRQGYIALGPTFEGYRVDGIQVSVTMPIALTR